MNKCKVCKSSNIIFFKIWKLLYWDERCGSKFLDPKNYISNSEKKHYLKHNNSITDQTTKFSLKLIEPVKDKITTSDIGLDYGCGFAPALANILKSDGFKVELYDPFFFPNKDVLLKKYKFITCSEVVEHFFNPYQEFDKINNLLDNNSWFGLMTSFLPNDNKFENWYYRRDPTHVVFYKKENFSTYWISKKLAGFFPIRKYSSFL